MNLLFYCISFVMFACTCNNLFFCLYSFEVFCISIEWFEGHKEDGGLNVHWVELLEKQYINIIIIRTSNNFVLNLCLHKIWNHNVISSDHNTEHTIVASELNDPICQDRIGSFSSEATSYEWLPCYQLAMSSLTRRSPLRAALESYGHVWVL